MIILLNRHYKLLSILVLCTFLVNCSNSYIDKVEKSEGFKYIPGYPELRVVSSSFIDENDNAIINIASEIVYGSLVYKKIDSLYVAEAKLSYKIIDLDNPENIIQELEFPIKISNRTNRLSSNQDTYKVVNNFEVSPGNFQVITTITDLNSQKEISRISELLIPGVSDDFNNISNVRIFKKPKGESQYLPVTTYDIKSNIDSLKFIFQISNNISDDPLTINTKLIRFESDTSIARPMNYNNYTPSSIEYKGIDYSDYTEVNSNRRVLTSKGNVSIEFTFSSLSRGNYRFEVFSNLGGEEELYRARDFSIKSQNYPTLASARELARPLYYLMGEKEYNNLMSIEDDLELKKAIDRFWLSNIQNSRKAKSIVELYYQRVEEANKQFSNYKEGWKTDPGMIYILFGNPWYSDTFINTMVWAYSYNREDPEKNFVFDEVKIKSKFYPFNNYQLDRKSFYFTIQYQQIQLWLNGNILKYY